jgi:hypothetical protein
MNTRFGSKGFVLLVLIMVLTSLSLITLACWHQMSLHVDVMREREHYLCSQLATQRVMERTLEMIKTHGKLFFDQSTSKKLPLTFKWIDRQAKIQPCYYTVVIDKAKTNGKDRSLLLNVALFEKNRSLCTLYAMIAQGEWKKFGVQEKQVVYVVHHCSFGTTLR